MNNDSSNGSISRRHLLVLTAGSAAIAACGSTINTADGSSDGGGDVNSAADASDDTQIGDGGVTCMPDPNNLVGLVTDFAMGTWTQISALDVIVSQDANGLYAFSDLCTHDRCPVNPPATNGHTYCACHGSRFDGNGAVLVGPATRPLPHFALTVCDGSVYVDTATRVAATSRTPPV